MNVWDKKLVVGNTDNYSVTISANWLKGDVVNGATVTSTSDPADLTVGSNTILDGNTISVALTGVTSGYHPVHFEYTTQTGRSDCFEAVVYVANNC